MTLPTPKDFPVLPAGYYFQLEVRKINPFFNERMFNVSVLGGKKSLPLVWETQVNEPELLDVAKKLAKLAYLKVSTKRTEDLVAVLNAQLKKAAHDG